jgi:hypothetical protein
MQLSVAIKLLRTFPSCNLRIFKQFSGFPNGGSAELGYVVFAPSSLLEDENYLELTAYAKTLNLTIEPYEQYLMVSGR